MPYFNKNKTIGINTNLQFFRRKKTHYATDNNSLQYFENDNFSSIDYDLNTEIIYRNNIHQKHKIKFTYLKSTVSDSITILNPNYLGDTNTTADLFNISYLLEHEKRDYSIYPLHGYALSFEIKKYFPSLDYYLLKPSYTGIRPILYNKDKSMRDFLIQDQDFFQNILFEPLGIFLRIYSQYNLPLHQEHDL